MGMAIMKRTLGQAVLTGVDVSRRLLQRRPCRSKVVTESHAAVDQKGHPGLVHCRYLCSQQETRSGSGLPISNRNTAPYDYTIVADWNPDGNRIAICEDPNISAGNFVDGR
jgi:hypothetical protein